LEKYNLVFYKSKFRLYLLDMKFQNYSNSIRFETFEVEDNANITFFRALRPKHLLFDENFLILIPFC
jgi:hypothetical protein